jgi:hypothetical protein
MERETMRTKADEAFYQANEAILLSKRENPGQCPAGGEA